MFRNAEQKPVPKRIEVTFTEAMKILLPYSWHQIKEQIICVAPVCIYLIIFQFTILRYSLSQIGWITGGIAVVILGLVFFLEGVRIGLVPLGETIGDILPAKSKLPTVLTFAFILGILAAFGEPVLGSLQIAGAGVDPQKAPLLYYILVVNPLLLSVTVSLGVGIAVLVGVLRYIYSWSLKKIILPLVALGILLTLLAARQHVLFTAVGLAWDTGAVIVGPVLCPLVLSLGLGVCRATGRSDSGMAGFGMVGLISVIPVAMVILLTYLLSVIFGDNFVITDIRTAASGVPSILSVAADSLYLAVRAIAPIFIFLFVFLRFFLKEEGIPTAQFVLGAIFGVVGLLLFNFGLSVGLAELGNQVGHRLPISFSPPENSLYPTEIGKIIVVAFGAVLGYGATLAEPAFNILGQQVEDATQGAFKKWLFGQAVAIGVGVGAGLGIVSVVYGVNLLYLLIPPYFLLFVLTVLNSEKFVNIAWDGGAVTTGPVTVPLKIAIGIALSHATGFAEGFGILALASAYPVLNILLLGLYVRYCEAKREAELLKMAEVQNYE